MLMLSSCSRSAIAGEGLPAKQIEQGSTPTPVVLATHPASTMEQPVRLVIPAGALPPRLKRLAFDPTANWQRQHKTPGSMWVGMTLAHIQENGAARSSMDTLIVPEARVTRIAYYTPDQAPLQDIFGNLGGVYLNLITCAGDWIASQHQTKLRLVVYTTFV